METDTGWWLIQHPDHARLASAFAAAWGNERFRKPEPRDRVLHAISTHDDGWAARDAHPIITREGKPSAFSIDLVGKYSAFEEIDIADYLAVRERAVRIIADKDPYAGMLISMHTYNLLTERADRSTISTDGLALLDAFLDRQRTLQEALFCAVAIDVTLNSHERSTETIHEHFRLLQACDNLSLLSCVSFDRPANLLHPLPLNDGTVSDVSVFPLAPRHFRLEPWPFAEEVLTFKFPARHVEGKTFESSEELERTFWLAAEERLGVTLSR
jgi:hypothetical protein